MRSKILKGLREMEGAQKRQRMETVKRQKSGSWGKRRRLLSGCCVPSAVARDEDPKVKVKALQRVTVW